MDIGRDGLVIFPTTVAADAASPGAETDKAAGTAEPLSADMGTLLTQMMDLQIQNAKLLGQIARNQEEDRKSGQPSAAG